MFFKIQFMACIGLMILFFSLSCSIKGNPSGDTEVVDMRINHFRQTAMGESRLLVYLVQEEDEMETNDWKYLYEEIEGFDYESGYTYELKVEKLPVENPPADASSIKYVLLSLVSKEKAPADESFDIHLKSFGENFVTGSGNDLYLLYEYKIDCTNMCENLATDLEAQENVIGIFTHGPDESLLLQAITYDPR